MKVGISVDKDSGKVKFHSHEIGFSCRNSIETRSKRSKEDNNESITEKNKD